MILPGTGRGTGEAGGGGARQAHRPEVDLARKLRRAMSLPEVMLWQRLRGAALGFRVRRQHPIGPYVVDFFCRELRLIIEIDGSSHDSPNAADHDRVRDAFLRGMGHSVLRLAAADVLRDPNGAAAAVAALAARPLHQPAAGSPPRSGEDQE